MADFYFPSLDIIKLSASGERLEIRSETILVENITQSVSLTSLTTDANGTLPEGSYATADPAADGDVIELSHATYPETTRLTLKSTQELAYTTAENNVAAFIIENLFTSTNDSEAADIYAVDTAELGSAPVYIGTAKAGATTLLPFQTGVPKTMRFYAISQDTEFQRNAFDFNDAPSVDLAIPAVNGSGAMRFDAAKTHNVNHGAFYIENVNYTSFYWDVFVRPTGANMLGYIISAGSGGAHNILLGFNSNSTHAQVTGNIWDGAAIKSFSSPQFIRLGDWVHVAVAWDLATILVYVNGVCEGAVAYVAANRSTPSISDSVLFVGGSDHSNYSFDLKWVRGIEGTLPHDFAWYGTYPPERYPRAFFSNGVVHVSAAFLADYSVPGEIIADVSKGFGTQGTHPGRRSVNADTGNFPAQPYNRFTESALPQWVAAAVAFPTEAVTTVPVDALIHDDFNRTSSPFWINTISIGSTEGGSQGVLAWQGTPTDYGTSYGRVFGTYTGRSPVWVDAGQQDVDVRFTCSNAQHIFIGYVRWTDVNNNIRVEGVPVGDGTDTLNIIKKVGGADTVIFSGATGAGTTTATVIRITVVSNTITVYYDGVSQFSGGSALPTGTNIGFKMDSSPTAKIDSITVYGL